MLLALPARIPIVDHSRPKPDHTFGKQIIHLPPPPVRIAALLPATCGAPAEAVATERVIAHAHVGWNAMPFHDFADSRLAIEKIADHLVRYLNGQDTIVQWEAGVTDLRRAVQQIAARGSHPQRSTRRNATQTPPSGTSSVLSNTPERRDARERQKHLEEGRRLSKVLRRLLDLDVELSEGIYVCGEHDKWRFTLKPWYGGSDGMDVGRLQPNGKYLESKRTVFNQDQLAEALVELGIEIAPAGHGVGTIQAWRETPVGKMIVGRGPVVTLNPVGDQVRVEINRLKGMRQAGLGHA